MNNTNIMTILNELTSYFIKITVSRNFPFVAFFCTVAFILLGGLRSVFLWQIIV